MSKTVSSEPMKMQPESTIRKVDNGFVVSQYNEKGRKEMVAKDMEEANGMMMGMMGMMGDKETKKPSETMKKRRMTDNGYMPKH